MEWCDILSDEIAKQRRLLLSWGRELSSFELESWIEKNSDDAGWNSSQIFELLKRVEKEFSAQDRRVPEDIVLYSTILIQYSVSLEKFKNGEFEEALSKAFSTRHYIGLRAGQNKQRGDSARAKRSTANMQAKQMVLEYYQENLLGLSNEAAARHLVEKRLAEIEHRTLVALISQYKKFCHTCDSLDSGSQILARARLAKAKIDLEKDFSQDEIEEAKNFLIKKKENDNLRIRIFIDRGEDFSINEIDYCNRQCLSMLA